MQRTLIKDLTPNTQVLIKGWVQEVRDLNKIKFVILRDRTKTIQCIARKNTTPDTIFDLISTISKESVIEITGKTVESKEAKGGLEIQIENIVVLNTAEPIPIDNSDKSTTELETRIDYRFIDTRNEKNNAIFRVRSKIQRAVVDFFDDHGFTNINTPKITCIGVESGAALFEVKYFDKKLYLAQSPQIYKQMFVAGGFERVYEIGVIFRAENSNTTRHLTEFTGIDFEMGFIKDFTEVMDMIEKMLINVLTHVKKECATELKLLSVDLPVPKKIPRMTMEDAKEFLTAKGRSYTADDDLDPEGERILGEMAKEQHDSEFIFITHYPWAVRPFYHMRPEDRQDLTFSFDLLFNGVEIATGAQREHRYNILHKQTTEKGMNLDHMKEYGDIFRYGIPPHGGVGFGLDRITQRLLGLQNVREAVLLPRDTKRIKP